MRADPAPLIGLAGLTQLNGLLCIVTAGCQTVLSRAFGLGALFVKGLRAGVVHGAYFSPRKPLNATQLIWE